MGIGFEERLGKDDAVLIAVEALEVVGGAREEGGALSASPGVHASAEVLRGEAWGDKHHGGPSGAEDCEAGLGEGGGIAATGLGGCAAAGNPPGGPEEGEVIAIGFEPPDQVPDGVGVGWSGVHDAGEGEGAIRLGNGEEFEVLAGVARGIGGDGGGVAEHGTRECG